MPLCNLQKTFLATEKIHFFDITGVNSMQKIVDEIAIKMNASTDRGKVANYIPELANIDPNQFSIEALEMLVNHAGWSVFGR